MTMRRPRRSSNPCLKRVALRHEALENGVRRGFEAEMALKRLKSQRFGAWIRGKRAYKSLSRALKRRLKELSLCHVEGVNLRKA